MAESVTSQGSASLSWTLSCVFVYVSVCLCLCVCVCACECFCEYFFFPFFSIGGDIVCLYMCLFVYVCLSVSVLVSVSVSIFFFHWRGYCFYCFYSTFLFYEGWNSEGKFIHQIIFQRLEWGHHFEYRLVVKNQLKCMQKGELIVVFFCFLFLALLPTLLVCWTLVLF